MPDDNENINTNQYFISTDKFAQIDNIYIRFPNGSVGKMEPELKYIFNAVAANGQEFQDTNSQYSASIDIVPSNLDEKHKSTLKFRQIGADQYSVDVYDLTNRLEAGTNISIIPQEIVDPNNTSRTLFWKLLISATDTTYTADENTLQLNQVLNPNTNIIENQFSIKSLKERLSAGTGITLSHANTSPYKTTIKAPLSSDSILLSSYPNSTNPTSWKYHVSPSWLSGHGTTGVSGGLSTILEGTINSAVTGIQSIKVKKKTNAAGTIVSGYDLYVNPDWISGSTEDKTGYNAVICGFNKYVGEELYETPTGDNPPSTTLKYDPTIGIYLGIDTGEEDTHLTGKLSLTNNTTIKTVSINLTESSSQIDYERQGIILSGSRGVTLTTLDTTIGSESKTILIISGTLYYGDTDQNAGFISSIVKDENNCFTVWDIHSRLNGENTIQIVSPEAAERLDGITTIKITPGNQNQVLKTFAEWDRTNPDNPVLVRKWVAWGTDETGIDGTTYYSGRFNNVDADNKINSHLSGDNVCVYISSTPNSDESISEASGVIKIKPANLTVTEFTASKGYILSTTLVDATTSNPKLSASWVANPGYITSYKNSTYSNADTSLTFTGTGINGAQVEGEDTTIKVNHAWLSTANPSAVITSVVTSYFKALTHSSTNNTLKIIDNVLTWSLDDNAGDHFYRYNCDDDSITFPTTQTITDYIAYPPPQDQTYINKINVNKDWLSSSSQQGFSAVIKAITAYIGAQYTEPATSEDPPSTTLKWDNSLNKIILAPDYGGDGGDGNDWYKYSAANSSLTFNPENSSNNGTTTIQVNTTWLTNQISSFLTGLNNTWSTDNSHHNTLKIGTDGSISWDEDLKGSDGSTYQGDGRTISGYTDASDNKNKFTIYPGAANQILSTTNTGTAQNPKLSAGWVNTPGWKTTDNNNTYSAGDGLSTGTVAGSDTTFDVDTEWLTEKISSFLTGISTYDSISTTLKIDTNGKLVWSKDDTGSGGDGWYYYTSGTDASIIIKGSDPNHPYIINKSNSTNDENKIYVNPAWLSGTNTAGTALSGGSKAISSFLKSTSIGSSLITGLASAFLTGLAHTNLTNPVLKINSSHQISWGEDITGGNDGNTRYNLSSVASITTNGNAAIQLLSSSNGTSFANQKSFKLSGDGTYVKVTTDTNGNFIINGSHTHTFDHNTAYIKVNKNGENSTSVTENITTTNSNTYITLVDGESRTSKIKVTGDNIDVSFNKNTDTLTLSCAAPPSMELDKDGIAIITGGTIKRLDPPTEEDGIYVLRCAKTGTTYTYGWIKTGGCDTD